MQFYENDGYLVRSVAQFVREGLVCGDYTAIVVTAAHKRAIERELKRDGLDLERFKKQGRYVAVDAAQCLLTLTENGQFDMAKAEELVTQVFASVPAGSCLRSFGEMVALMCESGLTAEAIQVEALWERASRERKCHLLCGYSIDSFPGAAHTASFSGICSHHSHVIPSESFCGLSDTSDQLRCIALLQQKARSLEAEIAQRNLLLDEVRLAAERERSFLCDVLTAFTDGRVQLCDDQRSLPAELPCCVERMTLEADTLWLMRRSIENAAADLDFPMERWADLVMAASEAAMNAVTHACKGQAVVSSDGGGTIQVRICDCGKGIARECLHRATLQRGFTTTGTMGHGFWIMFKTADRIWMCTGPQGTTVVMEQDRVAPLAPWLQEL